MRAHFLLVPGLLGVLGLAPVDVLAQAGCSQREARLLIDYDPRLMQALEVLDWQTYAALQQHLLDQLSLDCLVALGQEQVQRDGGANSAQSVGPSAYDRGGNRSHGVGGCASHGCVSH